MRKTNSSSGFGLLFSTGTALVSPVHEWVTRAPLYQATRPRRSPFFRPIARAVSAFERWHQHRKQLQDLARLDDRMLQDIGLTREDVKDELRRSLQKRS